ncbi:PorT family protein [bacterium]|nr:PorT family protein [bacterium]
MKSKGKKLIVVCVLFLISMTASIYSQSLIIEKKNININLWAGVAGSRLTGQSSFPVYGPYNNSKIGLSFGASVDTRFKKNIFIEAGLFYSQLGGSTEEQTAADNNGKVLGKYKICQYLDYIEIPVLVKFYIKQKYLNIFLEAGPEITVLLSGREKFNHVYNSLMEYDKNISSQIAKLNIGVNLGAGISYKITPNIKLNFICKYLFGLANQIKNSSVEDEQKIRYFKIVIGPSFKL